MWEQILAWLSERIERFDINYILTKVGGEVLGTFLFLLAAAIFAFVGGKRLIEAAKARLLARRVKGGSAEHYTILVAGLDGDTDGRQQRHIVQSLDRLLETDKPGTVISVRAFPMTLALNDTEDRAKARASAEARGRQWLAEKNADILVWGAVAKADQVLRLRVLSCGPVGSSEAKGYVLSETLELPLDFGSDLGAVLEGMIAASIAPAFESGRYVADILDPTLNRLRTLAQRPPGAFDVSRRRALQHSYAMTAFRLGEQKGDNARLEEAVMGFRAALGETVREDAPLDWAGTQNYLGNALCALGLRESGTARLEQAVDAFHAALLVRTREKVPLEWAATQDSLASALWTIGQRGTGIARLEQAIEAFRAALLERTREKAPLQWASTQNNLATALLTLGLRESRTARLEEAVAACHAALEEGTREKVPLDWAMTQHNLGTVLTALGQRESGTARLQQAVEAFHAALEEALRDRVPPQWALTQNNLGNALRELGKREGDLVHLESALAAYRAALEERTREKAPLQWATTQNNIGTALLIRAQIEGKASGLEGAVAAYYAALTERTRGRVPVDWAVTQNNLANALRALGEMQKSLECLQEARKCALDAIDVLARESATLYESQARETLSEIETASSALSAESSPTNAAIHGPLVPRP